MKAELLKKMTDDELGETIVSVNLLKLTSACLPIMQECVLRRRYSKNIHIRGIINMLDKKLL